MQALNCQGAIKWCVGGVRLFPWRLAPPAVVDGSRAPGGGAEAPPGQNGFTAISMLFS